jgi:hypothetical protein
MIIDLATSPAPCDGACGQIAGLFSNNDELADARCTKEMVNRSAPLVKE